MSTTDKNEYSMDKLNKIIDRYTDGNYLIGKTAKEEMAKDILALFNVAEQSEQLKAFREWWNEDNMGVCTTITHKDIERYLESL